MTVAVMPFVLELHRNAVASKAPQLFLQLVFQLVVPFPFQKLQNGCAAGEELRPIPPLCVLGIGCRDTLGIAGFQRFSAI